jgi:hypothetical protein
MNGQTGQGIEEDRLCREDSPGERKRSYNHEILSSYSKYRETLRNGGKIGDAAAP